MMSLPFGLFTQVSVSGPLGPLVESIHNGAYRYLQFDKNIKRQCFGEFYPHNRMANKR